MREEQRGMNIRFLARMAHGQCQTANGKWQMANGKWQMANGQWQHLLLRPEAHG